MPFNHNKHHISTTTMSFSTKGGRVVSYHEGLPPIKPHDPLIMLSCKINYSSTTRIATATKLCMIVTCFVGFLLIKSRDHFITWSCEITWQIETMFISTTVVPIAAKPGRIVTYLQGLITMKSNNALIT